MPHSTINRPKLAGFGALLLVLTAFGWLTIPAHIVSVWMDPEFTDWISPIANRLHDGARLYAYGLHVPMPPLPYILVRLLHPGGAIWIQENLLDYCFRAATILLLYHLLAKRVGTGLAFAACMAVVPVFLSFSKTILYDSMTQFLVAACGGLCASLVLSQSPANSQSRFRPAVLQGIALGLLMLTKQSTGAGAFMGVCLTLLFLPEGVNFQSRCVKILVVTFSMAATICLIALVFARFVSFPGMIHDVFLAGTEPKGGPGMMIDNLMGYSAYLLEVMVGAGAACWAALLILRGKMGWRDQWNTLTAALNLSVNARVTGATAQVRAMLAVGLAGVACAVAVYFVPAHGWMCFIPDQIVRRGVSMGLLNLGLAACLTLAAAVFIQGLSRRRGSLSLHPLAPFVMVYFCAAVFHTLSVKGFRWVPDNNPLIAVALVFVFSLLAALPDAVRLKHAAGAGIGLVCLGIAITWCTLFRQFKLVTSCTESWPEIRQLAGARLRPECEPLRELVRTVRSQANPGTGDTVLLLPNDPNVEAWFDRPRPALSCAIIFTDQYWDRYVDADFAALQANPPKVIVIGPRNYWRPFSSLWHPQKHEGAIRLIDRVKDELIPKNYTPPMEQPVMYGGHTDFMDVYVRKAPTSDPMRTGNHVPAASGHG